MSPTSPTSPTWYDVLGVSRDASSDEIKRAWREATDRFEPGSASGQFRMYNEAADVLLDPRQRAEYDATLGSAPVAEPTPQPELRPEPRPTSGSPAGRPEAVSPEEDEQEPVPTGATALDTTATREPISRRALAITAVLAALAIVLLVVAGWLALKVRDQSRIADARTEAPAAAEHAAAAILSYDYRTLPENRRRASAYLTPGFAKKYLETFRLLEKNKDGSPGAAVQTKTVVSSDVMGSGVVDLDADKARVLVYVDQTSRKAGVDPQVFQNRVTMTMERKGDRWLVGDLRSY